MGEYRLRGVDKLTGREVEHRIEAADRAEAQSIANNMGMAVESVEVVVGYASRIRARLGVIPVHNP